MGYNTDFNGGLTASIPLTTDQKEYINTFSRIRHMKRDVSVLQTLYKGKYGLDGKYGKEGEFFCKDEEDQKSIIDHNIPPSTQPGLWCQWYMRESDYLEWDGGEKFYDYIEWLKYLMDNFFTPWGVLFNGQIEWRGESWEDTGTIIVKNNKIEVNDRVR